MLKFLVERRYKTQHSFGIFQHVTNFEWYVSVLVDLTRIEGTKHGQLIADQMLDVAIRVQSIRPFAVTQMALLIENYHLLVGNSRQNSAAQVCVLPMAFLKIVWLLSRT